MTILIRWDYQKISGGKSKLKETMRKRDHKEAEVTVTMKGVVEKDQVTTASKILAASVVSIGLACTVLMYFFEVSHGGNTWKTGDWLINYSSGFIRRGLSVKSLFSCPIYQDLTCCGPSLPFSFCFCFSSFSS